MKKSRMLAATLCAVLMVGVLTVPAYAGGGDEGGEYQKERRSHLANSYGPEGLW